MTYDEIISSLYPESPPPPSSMPMSPFEAIQHGFQKHLKIRSRKDADTLSRRFHSAVEDFDPMSPDYARMVKEAHREVSGQPPGFFNNPWARSIFQTEIDPTMYAEQRIKEQAPNIFGDAVDTMYDTLTQLDPASPTYKLDAARVMSESMRATQHSPEAQKLFMQMAPTMLNTALGGWATLRARDALTQYREAAKGVEGAEDAEDQLEKFRAQFSPVDQEAATMFNQGVDRHMAAQGYTEEMKAMRFIQEKIEPWEKEFERKNRHMIEAGNPWGYLAKFDRELWEWWRKAPKVAREYIIARRNTKPGILDAQMAVIKAVNNGVPIELDQEHTLDVKLPVPSDVARQIAEAAPQDGDQPITGDGAYPWLVPHVSPDGSQGAEDYMATFGARSWPQQDYSKESSLPAAIAGAGDPVPTDPGGVSAAAANNADLLENMRRIHGDTSPLSLQWEVNKHRTGRGSLAGFDWEPYRRFGQVKPWREHGESYFLMPAGQKAQALGLTPPSSGWTDADKEMINEAGPAVKVWQDLTTAPIPPSLRGDKVFRKALKAAAEYELYGPPPDAPQKEFDTGLTDLEVEAYGNLVSDMRNADDGFAPYDLDLTPNTERRAKASDRLLTQLRQRRGMLRDTHYKNMKEASGAPKTKLEHAFGDVDDLEEHIVNWFDKNDNRIRTMRVRTGFRHMIGRALDEARNDVLNTPNIDADGEYSAGYTKLMQNIALPMAHLEKEGAGFGGIAKHVIEMLNESRDLDYFTRKLQDFYVGLTGENLIAKIEADFGYNVLREKTDRWPLMGASEPVALGVIHPELSPFVRMRAANLMQDIYGAHPSFEINEEEVAAGANAYFMRRKFKQETGGDLDKLEEALAQ